VPRTVVAAVDRAQQAAAASAATPADVPSAS
jgi:hypothetical protein